MNDKSHPSQRPSWDDYFMQIASVVAQRSTCLRRKVGAVLVLDKRILATGYNGAPMGLPHCAETGCLRTKYNVPSGERHELCRGLHAEENAFLQAARYGIRIEGATIYSTHVPCVLCTKMIINCGIKRIVAVNDYPDELAQQLLSQTDIKVDIKKGWVPGGSPPTKPEED
ncbi:MAG: cytidine/deoxycytidylate deaminase family protein [Planctomycetes bacterium]|nr:cytidine/deoxycytidylate deaminase family protein [Planctomycetota bacterium]